MSSLDEIKSSPSEETEVTELHQEIQPSQLSEKPGKTTLPSPSETESDTTFSSAAHDVSGEPERGVDQQEKKSESTLDSSPSELALGVVEQPSSDEIVNENVDTPQSTPQSPEPAVIDHVEGEFMVEIPLDREESNSSPTDNFVDEKNQSGLENAETSTALEDDGKNVSDLKVDKSSTLPFEHYSGNQVHDFDNGSNAGESSLVSGNSSSDTCSLLSTQPVHAAARSSGPSVFIGRSRQYRYLYNQIAISAKEALENKLDVSNMQGIINKVLSYSPVSKNELYFVRTQLEWLLGEVISLHDSSMSETEDEEEVLGEELSCSEEEDDLSTSDTPSCFSPDNHHNSQECGNGKIPPISHVIKKSPEPAPEPVSLKRKIDVENPEEQKKRTAVGIPVSSEKVFIPNPLKTSMPHSFSPAQDSTSPTLLGYYTFTDDKRRSIELEIHKRTALGQNVSNFSFLL